MRGSQRAATLPAEFFRRSTAVVARDLLGATIVSGAGRRSTVGLIVETEAYLGGDDPASHGYRLRRTERNAALFGSPGSWYVYRSYGVHWCANLVCEAKGLGAAVLLRAVQPMDGLSLMRRRRGRRAERELGSGPGKLCEALGIDSTLNGVDMAESAVRICLPDESDRIAVAVTPRIGITKAADWPLRFVVAGSVWASRSPRR